MLADIYALANERSVAVIERFLDRFLPNRAAAAEEYEVPQYALQPNIVLNQATDLVRLCVDRPDLEHAVYWCNRDSLGEPRAAHVFFLHDGGMVLGLSTARLETEAQDKLLVELKEFAESQFGCIAYEQPPPSCTTEFRKLAAKVT